MILRGPTWIRLEGPFPDLILMGNDQIAVALVLIPLVRNKWKKGNKGFLGLDICERLRIQCIHFRVRIRYIKIRIKKDGVLIDLVYID